MDGDIMGYGPFYNCTDALFQAWWIPLEAAGYSVTLDLDQKPDDDGGLSAIVSNGKARVDVYYVHAVELGGNVIGLHYAAPLVCFGKNYNLAKDIEKILLSSGAWLPKAM